MSDLSIPIPEDATPEEEEAIVNAAVDKRVEDDLDEMFKDFPKGI